MKLRDIDKAALIGLTLGVGILVPLNGCDVLPTLSPIPTPTIVPTSTPFPGWLLNPGFEGECTPGVVHIIDGIERDNICSPAEWTTWWKTGGELGQPEVKLVYSDDPLRGYDAELPRLRSGDHSVTLFTMWRAHEIGLYQCLCAPPGATLVFSAYAQAWTCNDNEVPGYTCVDDHAQITVSVGIDPEGWAHPCSRHVIWSESIIAPDAFHLVGPVMATVGDAGRVCVFLRTKAKWAFEHLDVYWDDLSLVVLEQ